MGFVLPISPTLDVVEGEVVIGGGLGWLGALVVNRGCSLRCGSSGLFTVLCERCWILEFA